MPAEREKLIIKEKLEKVRLFFFNHQRFVVTVSMSLFLLGCLLVYGFNHYNSLDNDDVSDILLNEPIDALEVNEEDSFEYIYVDIKGFVNEPGVYSFDKNGDYRVIDLINKAKGLKDNADTSNINLSLKLKDEMTIVVYSKEEVIKDITNNKSCNSNACLNESSSSDTFELVNINEATKEELMSLSGIGEAKALAIIKYREENGKFQEISEIMNVSGIGESVFTKIRDSITT